MTIPAIRQPLSVPLHAKLATASARAVASQGHAFAGRGRYHPFFTNSTEPATDADITHRRHAIIETTFADLIDGPLAHIPSGHFGANSAWAVGAAIAHNLLRAAATLAGTRHRTARGGATLRRYLVNIPARLARPQRKPRLHLHAHWPWEPAWLALWHNTIGRTSTA